MFEGGVEGDVEEAWRRCGGGAKEVYGDSWQMWRRGGGGQEACG